VITPSDSRTIVLPIELHSASWRQPSSRASRRAASVSAVSPDWEIPSASAPGTTTGER
jgi:hypothetical protein